MKEHETILKDLQEYLNDKGEVTKVSSLYQSGKWEISFSIHIFRYYYRVIGGAIQGTHDEQSIVSLADPRYKEKFYKYLIKKKSEVTTLVTSFTDDTSSGFLDFR